MRKKILLNSFFLLLFLYMLAINFHIPLFADDYCDSNNYLNLQGVFNVTYTYWQSWSGRLFSSFIVYLFLWKHTAGIIFFNIFNAFIFCALIYAIFLLGRASKPQKNADLTIFIFILALVWFSLQSVAEVAFWKDGSLVYLWPLTATLFFIYPYEQLLLGQRHLKDHLLSRLFFLLAGIILGTGLENLGAAVMVFFLVTLGYLYYKKRAIPIWAWLGICGYIVGFIVLLIAPGNYVRADYIYNSPGFHEQNFFEKLLPFTINMFKQLDVYFVFLLLLLIINFGLNFKKMCRLKPYSVFFILGMVSAYAMLGAPGVNFYNRTTFISSVFLIIALVGLLPKKPVRFMVKALFSLALIIVVFALVSDMAGTYKMYTNLYAQHSSRELYIKKSMLQNHRNLLVPPFYVPSRKFNTYDSPLVVHHRNFVSDITKNPQDWRNVCVARFYQLNTIALQPVNP